MSNILDITKDVEHHHCSSITDWEMLDLQKSGTIVSLLESQINQSKLLKRENDILKKEICDLKNILEENRNIYTNAINETNMILKENRKIYNETLKETTEILNQNREIYLDAVNKIFKLEKDFNEVKPLLEIIKDENKEIASTVSSPFYLNTMTYRLANREWRKKKEYSESPESSKPISLPYLTGKTNIFSLSKILSNK